MHPETHPSDLIHSPAPPRPSLCDSSPAPHLLSNCVRKKKVQPLRPAMSLLEAQKEDVEAGNHMFLSQDRFQLGLDDQYLAKSKAEIKTGLMAAIKEKRECTGRRH